MRHAKMFILNHREAVPTYAVPYTPRYTEGGVRYSIPLWGAVQPAKRLCMKTMTAPPNISLSEWK